MRSRVIRVARGLWQPMLIGATVVLVVGLAIAANPSVLSIALPELSAKLDGLSGDPLAAEKIRREIVQLELANRLAGSVWSGVIAFVPAVTAALGGLGLFLTIRREQVERTDRANKELAERLAEQRRQAESTYRATVQNLYADAAALRASAAVSLGTFLRSEYATYHDDVILVALAKLKKDMEPDSNVRRLVVRALEIGLRLRLGEITADQRSYFIDFYDCELGRIDLSGLDLEGADLGHAEMSHAILTGANLRRARGLEVKLDHARIGGGASLTEARLQGADLTDAHLHDAVAVSIRLERSILVGTEFFRARLQEAHFGGADLTGAKFQGADINNAFFAGAKLDPVALRSIAKGARNWQKAHFDPEHLKFLKAAVSSGGRGRAANKRADVDEDEDHESEMDEPRPASAPAMPDQTDDVPPMDRSTPPSA